jgi:hypothetical protein
MSARDRPADLMTALERAVEEGGDVRSHMGGDGRGGSSKGKRHHMSSRGGNACFVYMQLADCRVLGFEAHHAAVPRAGWLLKCSAYQQYST